jgi:hypothetical protein
MTHPDSDSTATIERDLHAVDAALHAGAADHDDPLVRELQELGLVLQADAAQPEAEFAEALEKRVSEGFPAAPGSTRALAEEVRSGLQAARAWPRDAVRNLPSPRRMLPAAGAVLTVVAVFVVVASVDFNSSDQGDGGGDSLVQSDGGGGAEGGGGRGEAAPGAGGGAELVRPGGQRQAARQAAPAIQPVQPDSAQPSIAPPPRGAGGFAPGRSDRKVERTISMTQEAPNQEIPALAQDVTRVTSRHGGFVLSSTLDSDQEGANGFFELRIPANRLRPALADLAGLATVREQSQSGQDVTRRHVTTRDRLQSARAERRSMLRRLELAATDEEAEAIRRRLDIVAGEINDLRAVLRNLRLRTAYAVVTVDLAGTDDDSGGSGGAGGSFDDAVGDAGDLVVGLAGVLIRVMAIALPLGLIAALGWLATSALRRRRRESALA